MVYSSNRVSLMSYFFVWRGGLAYLLSIVKKGLRKEPLLLSYLFKYYVFTAPERILPHCDMYLYAKPLQVNLFQKHLFLQQLTHNILSYCGLVYARIRGSNKELSTCTVKGLFTLKVRSFQEASNALISFKKYSQ